MTRISVVVPNYNGLQVLPACLDAVLGQTRRADEITVVDDASTDESVSLVRERYPNVNLVSLPTNGGFCKAANAGLRAATGDWIALLNNDTVADARWLAELEIALDAHPQVGLCASKLLFMNDPARINSAGLFMRKDGVGRDIGFGEPDGAAYSVPQPVFGASGGAAIYRRAALHDAGFLDEDLGAYAEDLDLSFRAQLLGWSCLYVPGAVVYHQMGATYRPDSPTKVYYSSRNMLTVVLKDMPTGLLRRYGLLIFAAQVYQVLYFTSRGRGGAAVRGKVDALAKLRETRQKRNVIQRNRRVPDAYIDALLTPPGLPGRMRGIVRRSRRFEKQLDPTAEDRS